MVITVDYDQFKKPEVVYKYFTGVNCTYCKQQKTLDALKDMKTKEKVIEYSDGVAADWEAFKTHKVTSIPYVIKFIGNEEIGRENFQYGAGYEKLKDKVKK